MSETIPFPLFNRSHKGVDGVVLSDDAAIQYNGFIDALGGLNIRPGEALAANTGKRCDGLFYWPDKNIIVSVSNGTVEIWETNGEVLNSLYSSSVTFPPGQIVSFCNDATYLVMAGGGKINYMTDLGVVTEVSDVDAPTSVTHVAFLDGYVLAINSNNKFYWADVSNVSSWSSLSFASAEANPDKIQSLQVIQRQIYLLGTVSTEIWENDGSTPFSRIPGGSIEIGCGAKYSPVKRKNSLIWLSDSREFVEFSGINAKIISSRYAKEIANFSTVSDCIGSLVSKDGQEYCLFQFPTEERTLAYNPAIDDWSEWGAWSRVSLEWLPYDFRASCYDIVTGKTFIGKSRAAVITCLKSDSRADITSASTSENFKFLRQTGFIDNATSKKKRLDQLRFRAKRGGTTSSSSTSLMLRYRNNGSPDWSNINIIDLGAIGDTEHQIKLHRLGVYESRQFEISVSDDTSVVLSNAEGDITIIR